MSFSETIGSVFRNYATFSGRAPRSEYWYYVLFTILVAMATGIVDMMLFPAWTGFLRSPRLPTCCCCYRAFLSAFADCMTSTAAGGGFCSHLR
jgi:uncharacterized membrane protein YhaH (DUF805 family)